MLSHMSGKHRNRLARFPMAFPVAFRFTITITGIGVDTRNYNYYNCERRLTALQHRLAVPSQRRSASFQRYHFARRLVAAHHAQRYRDDDIAVTRKGRVTSESVAGRLICFR